MQLCMEITQPSWRMFQLSYRYKTYPGCRKGHPSLPGSCTAKVVDRSHEDNLDTGCIHHSNVLATQLYICENDTSKYLAQAWLPRKILKSYHKQWYLEAKQNPIANWHWTKRGFIKKKHRNQTNKESHTLNRSTGLYWSSLPLFQDSKNFTIHWILRTLQPTYDYVIRTIDFTKYNMPNLVALGCNPVSISLGVSITAQNGICFWINMSRIALLVFFNYHTSSLPLRFRIVLW